MLKELAVNTPTFFFQQVQQFFDCVFNAIRDSKVGVVAVHLSVATLWCLVFALTHSMLVNEALVPRGCADTALRTRHSFHELYFYCLGKQPNETGFKMNFLPMKGEILITSYCIILIFKLAKI